ncbi:MAG: hypothetical protein M1831_002692 [Alyxoria varia]|nr:MAG: hypothetical protein M1831_002692 [Alyxoria varia]
MPNISKPSWQEVAEEAQSARDESVRQVRSVDHLPDPNALLSDVTGIPERFLTNRQLELTETEPERLRTLLASGKLTSSEVTEAFLHSAAIAQVTVNCITELLPERARQRARELDEYFEQHGKPFGPLHGLPISVKEHVSFKGLGVNGGNVSMYGTLAEKDAHVLRILSRLGVVFYTRTTEPQSLMHLETSSNLFGETVNPYNRALTAGGSSGGEGALLAMRGSCLGIGSDIGGSIRSPAANNGIYGFKPTSYRLPSESCYHTNAEIGMEQIIGTVGPMSTSLEGVKLFMKAIIDTKPWLVEPMLVPIPWRMSEPQFRKPLKIGVLWDDAIVKPHPPITRALYDITSKLRKAHDIELVDWHPYQHDRAWAITNSLFFCDGGAAEASSIDASGEPWRPLTKAILKESPHVKRRSIEEVWNLTLQRDRYRNEHAQSWNETATGSDQETGEPTGMVDVILCPAGPGVAPPLNCSRYWNYTSQWNLLDCPALVFPVGQVDQEKDVKDESYEPRNRDDRYNHELYTPERYRNAPVSLQLVARRFEDEKVIQALELIQKSL